MQVIKAIPATIFKTVLVNDTILWLFKQTKRLCKKMSHFEKNESAKYEISRNNTLPCRLNFNLFIIIIFRFFR